MPPTRRGTGDERRRADRQRARRRERGRAAPARQPLRRLRRALLPGGDELHALLGDRGRLWSWTVQMFRPKPPYDGDDGSAGFVPYGVGYVEMDCGLKIEARLRLRGRASLRIGEPMRLVLETYRHAPDGRPVQVFAFEPDAAA
jgi:hypothetical protein